MEKGQEEIIELTEVVAEPEDKETGQSLKEPPGITSFERESVVTQIMEKVKERIEAWLATEGVQVLNHGMRQILPPIFGEELSRELEKLKSEVEKIRTLKEGLSAKIKEWLEGEGYQLIKKETREILPKIGEELLGKEINQLQEEVEKIKGLREALNSKAEQWFRSEGILVLREKAMEVISQITQERINQELEKWHQERQKIKDEEEAWQKKREAWLSQEGVAILENKAREMFPKIAIAVLQKEIAKLKGEVEEQE